MGRPTERKRRVRTLGKKGGSLEAVHGAVVVAKPPIFDEAEAQAFVEAVRARVALQRIDQHRLHLRIGETALEGELHHLRAEALAEIARLTDPDVDGSQ